MTPLDDTTSGVDPDPSSQIPMALIEGRVMCVLWPPSRMSIINNKLFDWQRPYKIPFDVDSDVGRLMSTYWNMENKYIDVSDTEGAEVGVRVGRGEMMMEGVR